MGWSWWNVITYVIVQILNLVLPSLNFLLFRTFHKYVNITVDPREVSEWYPTLGFISLQQQQQNTFKYVQWKWQQRVIIIKAIVWDFHSYESFMFSTTIKSFFKSLVTYVVTEIWYSSINILPLKIVSARETCSKMVSTLSKCCCCFS